MIGETIGGRYEILRAIGEGGMGAVYEARHTGTGRRVALKTIHPGKVKSPQILARFRVEARAAGSIESEYVVQVFDVDVDEERRMPFLAMEFLAGDDLDGLLEKLTTLPQDLALRIGAQACLGLEKAHSQGVLHRDIKPANLLLAERDGGERRIKIVDFGLAKALSDSEGPREASLTVSGMLLGSPQYMSPEQARAQKGIDARTDVWSLGMVLYEMLTGRTAFQGVSPIPKLLEAITSQPVAPVRDSAPWVDVGVAAAVERALAIDPEQRYPTVQALREALTVFLPNGFTIQKSMLVAGPKPVARKAAPAQNDIVTVAKPAPAGAVAIRPTKVSGKASADAGAQTPGTDPLPKLVIPVEVSNDPPARAKAPAGGTLVSGQGPAPTVRGGAPAAEVAPRTQRMVAPLASNDEPALPARVAVPAIPQPPAARPASRSGMPIATIVTAGVAAAGLAVGAVWLVRGNNQGGADLPNSATGARETPITSSAPASSATPSAPKASTTSPAHPLVGRWKTEAGKAFEAIDVGGAIEFRVADLKGFAEQGYALGEARFTLRPDAADATRFTVVDHVRPLPPTTMAFDESARSTCLIDYDTIANKPLLARLDKGQLIVSATYLVPRAAMFESTGNRITKCKDLDKSTVSVVESTLKRAD